ncbi:MAG: FAD-binding oxidoreductase [Bacteroidia bacterium]
MKLSSGYPYWLIKDGLPFDYTKLEESIKTDVVILGGGISGALVAYYLINEGINCIVLDARTIGLGSTCASTSLLQYEIDTPLCELKNMVGLKNAVRAYHLCVDAIETIESISSKLNYSEFQSKKSLYYAAHKKDISFLKEEFAIRKQNGFKVKYLDEKEVENVFHINAPCAILSQCAGVINAYSFTHALHQYGIKKGLKVYDRTPVKEIKHSKNGVVLTSENGKTIKAKKIVYATGYEAVSFIKEKIVDLHSTYAIISEQANEKTKFWKDDVLIWNTADPYLYMRTTKDKRILIGGRDEEFFNTVKRDKLIDKKKKQLVKDFNHVFPGIEFNPEFSWTGTFGATKDGLPYIGEYKSLPNSYFALGFGGNGITFSVIAAKIIIDMITGKKNKDSDIFSFNRV